MKELIVVVEDEPDLLELLEYNLRKEGFDVEGFLTPSRIEDLLTDESVALLIMDRNLPNCDGLDVVKNLRKQGFDTPVIFLTAKIEDKHKIEGLEAGADDYITKPFNIAELMLRVKAVMRRTGSLQESVKYRGITLVPDAKQAFVDDMEVQLTKLEFNLLYELVQNKNSVLTRETLLYRVWKDEESYQDRTVDVAIKRLKEKIDPTRGKNYIISIRGVGYKLC
jgi:two-component system, OmpR family, alkaline phosphatase synthesis response regulator PhoP